MLLTDSGLTLDELLPALSWQPASIAGVGDRQGRAVAVGEPANLAVVDPAARWIVDASAFGGHATNSP